MIDDVHRKSSIYKQQWPPSGTSKFSLRQPRVSVGLLVFTTDGCRTYALAGNRHDRDQFARNDSGQKIVNASNDAIRGRRLVQITPQTRMTLAVTATDRIGEKYMPISRKADYQCHL